MGKLKPCPFCGSEDIKCKDFSRTYDIWFIQCQDCGATFPHFDTEAEAIEAWNTRHEPPTPGGAIVPAGNERLIHNA
jgi:Lar family restriction alleviation protein